MLPVHGTPKTYWNPAGVTSVVQTLQTVALNPILTCAPAARPPQNQCEACPLPPPQLPQSSPLPPPTPDPVNSFVVIGHYVTAYLLALKLKKETQKQVTLYTYNPANGQIPLDQWSDEDPLIAAQERFRSFAPYSERMEPLITLNADMRRSVRDIDAFPNSDVLSTACVSKDPALSNFPQCLSVPKSSLRSGGGSGSGSRKRGQRREKKDGKHKTKTRRGGAYAEEKWDENKKYDLTVNVETWKRQIANMISTTKVIEWVDLGDALTAEWIDNLVRTAAPTTHVIFSDPVQFMPMSVQSKMKWKRQVARDSINHFSKWSNMDQEPLFHYWIEWEGKNQSEADDSRAPRGSTRNMTDLKSPLSANDGGQSLYHVYGNTSTGDETSDRLWRIRIQVTPDDFKDFVTFPPNQNRVAIVPSQVNPNVLAVLPEGFKSETFPARTGTSIYLVRQGVEMMEPVVQSDKNVVFYLFDDAAVYVNNFTSYYSTDGLWQKTLPLLSQLPPVPTYADLSRIAESIRFWRMIILQNQNDSHVSVSVSGRTSDAWGILCKEVATAIQERGNSGNNIQFWATHLGLTVEQLSFGRMDESELTNYLARWLETSIRSAMFYQSDNINTWIKIFRNENRQEALNYLEWILVDQAPAISVTTAVAPEGPPIRPPAPPTTALAASSRATSSPQISATAPARTPTPTTITTRNPRLTISGQRPFATGRGTPTPVARPSYTVARPVMISGGDTPSQISSTTTNARSKSPPPRPRRLVLRYRPS